MTIVMILILSMCELVLVKCYPNEPIFGSPVMVIPVMVAIIFQKPIELKVFCCFQRI